jgi:hypothetical protein
MSATLCWSAVAGVASLLLLIPLARRDPKRLRAAMRSGTRGSTPLSPRHRRALAWSSAAPGLLLILAGQWPAFLIWLGAATASGWALAQLLAPGPRSR